MAVALPVAEVAFHPFATTCSFIGIHHRLDSMLLNIDGGWSTIIWREEPSGLWRSPHNVCKQPLHVLRQGSILAQTLVHICVISHHGPSCRDVQQSQ